MRSYLYLLFWGAQPVEPTEEEPSRTGSSSDPSGAKVWDRSRVEEGMEHIELEAAILDPKVTEHGFVLTCSAHLMGSGVRMKLGVGDEFYEAQFSDLVDNHRRNNPIP